MSRIFSSGTDLIVRGGGRNEALQTREGGGAMGRSEYLIITKDRL